MHAQNGKGDKNRPRQISSEEWNKRWGLIKWPTRKHKDKKHERKID